MSFYNYTKNKSDCVDIEKHMRQCSGLFNPPLASYVNIYDYATKIRSNAVTFEAWKNDELIGLIACYLNNYETLDGYVTNISTLQEHQGRGIASILLNKAIEAALDENFKTLSLEVEVENKKAIDLYRKAGFVLNGRRGNKYLMINRLLENRDVLVSICCVTYNHVKYIRNAIEGFLIQKVNFSIEILIHDDASIDGTADIIREYESKFPDLIKPIYQSENQYSQDRAISAVYQFPRARGKYIALCEGDDYWTDPYKLQKQVDLLESNSEYGLAYSDIAIVDGNNKTILKSAFYERLKEGYASGNVFFKLIKKNFISTPTVVARKTLIWNYLQQFPAEVFCIDFRLWLHIAHYSKVGCIDEKLAVYRIHDNGLSKSENFFSKRTSLIKQSALVHYFIEGKTETENRIILGEVIFQILNNRKLSFREKEPILKLVIKQPILCFYVLFWIRYKIYSKFIKLTELI